MHLKGYQHSRLFKMEISLFSTKTGKIVTIVVVVLVIVSVSVPVYISTLKRDTGKNTGSENGASEQINSENLSTTKEKGNTPTVVTTTPTSADNDVTTTPTSAVDRVTTGTDTPNTGNERTTVQSGTIITTAQEDNVYVSSGSLTFSNGVFHLNDTQFRIVSGAIHYFRTVPDYWRDRLLKLKACGMNTVETFTESHRDDPHSSAHVVVYKSEGKLTFANGNFTLDGNPFKILSGAVHYFRTFPDYWRDRLLKVKACGLNTVETYVPWNLHEEYPGKFDFEGILDLRKFIQLAHDLGLYVIFRPGPYICSEWDFGGLPAWLLNDPNMKVRSNYSGYTEAVERYFNTLLPMIVDLQYAKGGPIIAFQIENEFGSYSSDVEHLKFLKNLYIKHSLTELYLTSDNAWGYKNDAFYQHALPTANFQKMVEGKEVFDQIRAWSSEFPLMVTEFWTGWFDHWGSKHGGLALEDYENSLREILQLNASINFYMFHGGTNFGFMNGANMETTYKPDVTSYDYDSLLTENGDITPKYLKTREILLEYIYKPQGITSLPDIPENTSSTGYGSTSVDGFCSFDSLLGSVNKTDSPNAVPMEMLKLHGKYGQNYGYILYRCEIPGNSSQLMFDGRPTDRAQIYLDDVQVALLDWKSESTNVTLPSSNAATTRRLDILVENHGRVNYAREETGILDNERKGIRGSVKCDDKPISNFTIFPLEFKNGTVFSKDWETPPENLKVPALFRANLNITGQVNDTLIFMKGWGKGIVFMNGFNLGRYWSVGPQQTLYVPAPVLKNGNNEIVFFEHERVGNDILFTEKPILDVNNQTEIKL